MKRTTTHTIAGYIVFAFLTGLLLAGCGGGSSSSGDPGSQNTVATPQFSPETGTYTVEQSVTITCATPGATIRYTTDGSDPAGAGGIEYTPGSVITVSRDCIVQAVAAKDGMADSRTGYAWYDFAGPGGPAITGITTGVRQATVSWDPVPGAIVYTLYHAEGTNTTKATGTRILNVTSPYTVTNIRGRAHAFFIVAIDSNGEGAAGPVQTATPAKGWLAKGGAGFTAGQAGRTCIKMGQGNIPYLAFVDSSQGNKASVVRYGGAGWESVGSAGFSADVLNYLSLALGSDNTPYVAFQDGASEKAMVMRYNGTAWEVVGSAGFSADAAAYTSLALGSDNTPYVAYRDYAYSLKATVMRYSGTAWEAVGSAGFSANDAIYTSLALDSDNAPYVAYCDQAKAGRATVMRYSGTAWEVVGSAGFSAWQASYVSLALGPDNAPYVAYSDGANGNKATVMRYTGTAWEAVGGAGLSAGDAHYTSLALDSDNAPYVAFSDYANGSRATVMVYE